MARFRFIVCDWTNQIWNRGCGLVKGSVNTSFCVQLVFAPNRKSTFSVSDGAMNYHCCQMSPFTSRLELELLILFIYWNIKSLICQMSGPSFIILAAACHTGLEGFPSNDFWSNCPRLFPFLRLSFAFRLQVFSIGSCPSASQRPCFYLPDVPVFRHAHAAELIKKLAFEHQFITRHHFVIWPLFHPPSKDGSHANSDFLWRSYLVLQRLMDLISHSGRPLLLCLH